MEFNSSFTFIATKFEDAKHLQRKFCEALKTFYEVGFKVCCQESKFYPLLIPHIFEMDESMGLNCGQLLLEENDHWA